MAQVCVQVGVVCYGVQFLYFPFFLFVFLLFLLFSLVCMYFFHIYFDVLIMVCLFTCIAIVTSRKQER